MYCILIVEYITYIIKYINDVTYINTCNMLHKLNT